MKRWWIVAIGAAVAAAGWLWIARERQDIAWERITRAGVMVAATDASYPPFSALDANGALFGFDIDLAEAIGRRWGVRVEFETIAYDALLPALVAGRDDLVVSAFVPQPGRLHEVSYSQPYFTGGTVLVIPAAAEAPGADLAAWSAGRRLAVEYGAAGDALARRWSRLAAGVSLLPEATALEALQRAADGEADGAVVDALSAYAFLKDHPELKLAGAPAEPEPYVIAVSARSPRLLRAVNEALQALEADGTLPALRREWLGGAE